MVFSCMLLDIYIYISIHSIEHNLINIYRIDNRFVSGTPQSPPVARPPLSRYHPLIGPGLQAIMCIRPDDINGCSRYPKRAICYLYLFFYFDC